MNTFNVNAQFRISGTGEDIIFYASMIDLAVNIHLTALSYVSSRPDRKVPHTNEPINQYKRRFMSTVECVWPRLSGIRSIECGRFWSVSTDITVAFLRVNDFEEGLTDLM
jgi:hypothetical protein